MSQERRVGLLAASSHIMSMGGVVGLILSGNEPDWPMYWMLLILFDFPVVLAYLMMVFPIASFIPQKLTFLPSPYNDVFNFILPTLVFGLAGTVWWYHFPKLLLKAGRRFKRKSLLSAD